MKNFLKRIFRKRKNRMIIVLPLGKIKIIAAILALIGAYAFVQSTAFDMYLDCERESQICTISKTNQFDNTPIIISRFNTIKIYDVATAPRVLENNKKVYDILINYGADNGQAFMGFAFTNPINANTAMVQFSKYLERHLPTLHTSKHCYFNEYFCFIKGKE